MKASGVKPVEPRRAVVYGVEAPQCLLLVLPSVYPVARQLADNEHQRNLRQQWPFGRPQSYAKSIREPPAHSHSNGNHRRRNDNDQNADTNCVACIHTNV